VRVGVRPGTLFYADPPYLPDVRSPGVYRREVLWVKSAAAS
jgi:site-specific DNA-adenine methylase